MCFFTLDTQKNDSGHFWTIELWIKRDLCPISLGGRATGPPQKIKSVAPGQPYERTSWAAAFSGWRPYRGLSGGGHHQILLQWNRIQFFLVYDGPCDLWATQGIPEKVWGRQQKRGHTYVYPPASKNPWAADLWGGAAQLAAPTKLVGWMKKTG